ncbi:MAG: glycosyltransferase family 4 protein [Ignavibacteriae bacterium]|nr:glycosyltransferase family 4 protein [Ignavibacteriota bacterium]
MKKLLLVANVDWFFISHRLCIAEEAVRKGWDVTVACEDTGRAGEIRDCGINFVDLSFSRSGTNPTQELKTLWAFYQLYKNIKPDVLHHITLKPVIYGTFISKLLKTPAVLNAVSGLGYNFTGTRRGLVQKTMIRLMRYGFKRKNLAFIFQNKDDFAELSDMKVIERENKIHFIKGSGVDLTKFINTGFPDGDRVKILLPTRMLWDKGVAELRVASKILKNDYHNKISFILAGLADEDNKAGVPSSYLKEWEDGEYVKWIGYKKEMAPIYNDSDIVVLPSYREGMPKTLLEACAVGRSIVTTDAIGCRECVDENVNGFKVPVKSTIELAEAIKKLVDNENLRISMGMASRMKAEKEFDQKQVISKHLLIYEELLNA